MIFYSKYEAYSFTSILLNNGALDFYKLNKKVVLPSLIKLS